MSDRKQELAAKRQTLLAQSALQREQLAAIAGDLHARLAGIDRGIEIARSIARKPTVIAGVIAVLAFIGPRRIGRAVGRSAMFLATSRRLLGMFRTPLLALPRGRQKPSNEQVS